MGWVSDSDGGGPRCMKCISRYTNTRKCLECSEGNWNKKMIKKISEFPQRDLFTIYDLGDGVHSIVLTLRGLRVITRYPMWRSPFNIFGSWISYMGDNLQLVRSMNTTSKFELRTDPILPFKQVVKEEINRQVESRERTFSTSALKSKLHYHGYWNKCIVCGNDLGKDERRTTYCSKPCRQHYNDYDWSVIRYRVLAEEPICMGRGCENPSEEVHHIIPISKGGDPWARENLRALCFECHKAIHGKKYKYSHMPEQVRIQRWVRTIEDFIPVCAGVEEEPLIGGDGS